MHILMLNEMEVQRLLDLDALLDALAEGIQGTEFRPCHCPETQRGLRSQHRVSAYHADLSPWPRSERQIDLRLSWQ